jgi:hypothetical protein
MPAFGSPGRGLGSHALPPAFASSPGAPQSLASRGQGEIAQLVEHTTENRGVPGSSPGLAILVFPANGRFWVSAKPDHGAGICRLVATKTATESSAASTRTGRFRAGDKPAVTPACPNGGAALSSAARAVSSATRRKLHRVGQAFRLRLDRLIAAMASSHCMPSARLHGAVCAERKRSRLPYANHDLAN